MPASAVVFAWPPPPCAARVSLASNGDGTYTLTVAGFTAGPAPGPSFATYGSALAWLAQRYPNVAVGPSLGALSPNVQVPNVWACQLGSVMMGLAAPLSLPPPPSA